MGALHDGHLALVKKAKEMAQTTVVSIFVNKAQFNDASDYEKYPRQLEIDLEKLKSVGANFVFAPEFEEVFPEDFAFKVTPIALVDCLCGSVREGHFNGVSLIVSKLFNIIKPDIAIFGQKDFQQLQVIKKLARDLNFDIEIFAHETQREKSGLAMSSRNQRLVMASRIKAANIFRILSEIKNEIKIPGNNLAEVLQKKSHELLNMGFDKIDYLEIRQEENLKLVEKFDEAVISRIFIAVYLDEIRLIDNLRL